MSAPLLNLLKATIALSILGLVFPKIQVVEPKDFSKRFQFEGADRQSLEVSVSAFGQVPYNEEQLVQVFRVPEEDPNACSPLTRPRGVTGPFAWLMRRGNCTYSKKSNDVEASGALVGFVYDTDPTINIHFVIPAGDYLCQLTSQLAEDSALSD